MTDRDTKIHALGAKKLSLTGKNFYQTSPQNSFPVNKPTLIVKTLPQPQVRYIMVQHPQFDNLMKEFSALRAMYDELLTKFQQKNTQESLKANIQEVIQSTHEIEAKMNQFVEDAANNGSQKVQQQNQQCIEQALESEKARHEKQCLQIIETVNRATEKIEELENKNKDLKKQVQSQKQWREALQKENKRLRLMFQTMQSEKQEEIEKLKRQIKMAKESYIKPQKQQKKEEEQQREEKIQPTLMKKKIDNSQYLAESQINEGDMSGFSRLSINAQTTRKSRVYE